jgi:hypothetical protein
MELAEHDDLRNEGWDGICGGSGLKKNKRHGIWAPPESADDEDLRRSATVNTGRSTERERDRGLVQEDGELTRVNSTNVLDEGLRIGEIGRRMNSKVRLVEIGVYQK